MPVFDLQEVLRVGAGGARKVFTRPIWFAALLSVMFVLVCYLALKDEVLTKSLFFKVFFYVFILTTVLVFIFHSHACRTHAPQSIVHSVHANNVRPAALGPRLERATLEEVTS